MYNRWLLSGDTAPWMLPRVKAANVKVLLRMQEATAGHTPSLCLLVAQVLGWGWGGDIAKIQEEQKVQTGPRS